MFNRIRALLRKDIRAGGKDSMITYVVIAPILMALLMSMFLPFLENMEMHFAVSQDVDSILIEQLEEYGRVTVYPHRQQVIERVLAMDDVPGIVMGADGYQVILEGNEVDYVQEIPGMLLDYLVHGTPVSETQVESFGLGQTTARQYGAVFLLLSAILIGGLVIGLTIIEEKETKTLQAYAVSPVSISEYLLGKSLLGVGVIFLLTFATAYIMVGPEISYGLLFWVVVTGLPAGLIFGFIIGNFADNQLGAVAIMKILFMVFLFIPLASLFINSQWEFLFYPFLNYWLMKGLESIVVKGNVGIWASTGWTVLTSIVPLMLLWYQMKKRLGF